MARYVLALFLLVLPSIVRADSISCELPWFIRNLMFDRAGYCFSSPLGRALFDNADCTGSEALSSRDAAAVAQIRELERWLGCAVNTDARRLEHQEALAYLRGIAVLPVPVEGESGCIGYLGPDLPLLTAPGRKAGPMLGVLRRGADISFGFLDEGAWAFVAVHPRGWATTSAGQVSHGWVRFAGDRFPECRQYAG